MGTYLLLFLFSITSVLILVPPLTALAIKINWVDAPNHRKLHKQSVPLIGGFVIGLTTLAVILLNITDFIQSKQTVAIFTTGFVLLLMGVIDDKREIRALLKLIIQLSCAAILVKSGIGINSLYGIFGIETLPSWLASLLSVFIITGVVNAYNLMDGVDGLAGVLAIVAIALLIATQAFFGITNDIWIHVALIGSILGFLRFNLSAKHKIFMGDAGSLFLGNIIVGSSMSLLQNPQIPMTYQNHTVAFLIAIMFLPVIDSLRVYLERWSAGISPFTPQRNHIHHLLLQAGFSAKGIRQVMLVLSVFFVGIVVFSPKGFSITLVLGIFFLIYKAITFFLKVNKGVEYWKEKIHELESPHKK